VKILVKRGRKAFPCVVDSEDIREDAYFAHRNKVPRAVCVKAMVFRLHRDRAPDYLRVMPEDMAQDLEALRAQIRGLQARCHEIIDEAWVRSEPYVVPKP